MTVGEDLLLAFASRGCPPRRAGRRTWRARCPSCGQDGALTITSSPLHGLGLLCSGGCARRDVLEALGADGR